MRFMRVGEGMKAPESGPRVIESRDAATSRNDPAWPDRAPPNRTTSRWIRAVGSVGCIFHRARTSSQANDERHAGSPDGAARRVRRAQNRVLRPVLQEGVPGRASGVSRGLRRQPSLPPYGRAPSSSRGQSCAGFRRPVRSGTARPFWRKSPKGKERESTSNPVASQVRAPLLRLLVARPSTPRPAGCSG